MGVCLEKRVRHARVPKTSVTTALALNIPIHPRASNRHAPSRDVKNHPSIDGWFLSMLRVSTSYQTGGKLRHIYDAVKAAAQSTIYSPKEVLDPEDSAVYQKRKVKNRTEESVPDIPLPSGESTKTSADFSYLGSGVRYAYSIYAQEHGVSVSSKKGWMGPLEFRRAVQASLALWVFRTCDRLPPDDQERVKNKLRCEPYAINFMRIEERTAPVRTQDYDLAKTMF